MPKKKKAKEALSAEQIHEHLDRMEAGQDQQFIFSAGLGCVAVGISLSTGPGRCILIGTGGALMIIAFCWHAVCWGTRGK
jgi:hypothetical protein